MERERSAPFVGSRALPHLFRLLRRTAPRYTPRRPHGVGRGRMRRSAPRSPNAAGLPPEMRARAGTQSGGRVSRPLEMAQVFHPSTNTLSKVTIFGGVFFLAAVTWGLCVVDRTPWITEAEVARDQPVPFSHKHHVEGMGIDCRFCHTGVEESSFAGIPPTKTCMGCHSQVWKDAPALEPVRESWRTDQPIAWTRHRRTHRERPHWRHQHARGRFVGG